jgi:hypothetical protein
MKINIDIIKEIATDVRKKQFIIYWQYMTGYHMHRYETFK